MTLIFLSMAWLTGIYLGSHAHLDPRIVAPVSLLPLLPALVWRKGSRLWLIALCLTLLGLGVVRYETALPAPDYGSVALYVGPRTVEVGAVVTAEPDTRDQDLRLVVSVYHIGSGQDSYKVTGGVLVYVPRYSAFRYGDDLLLRGVLQDPPAYEDFSYKGYLARQGIYAIMYRPSVQVVARAQSNRLLAALYDFKGRLQRAITVYLPEPHAGLVQGILLGVKAVMTDDLKTDLTRTGLMHIVVVSGYNLTVVATLLQRLSEKRLRRNLALLVALLGVIAFTLMTGASTPVVRAAVMVSMTLLARAVGRESDALTSLLFAAALLVGISPLALWDVSFQLSFLATLGLVLFASPIEKVFALLPLGLATILGATFAAQITTLPVIALNFQRISLISPLANLLVQPAISPLMVTGAITAVAGLTGHVAVRFFGWLSWLISAYMVQVMKVLGDLPQASVDIPALPLDQQPVALITYGAAVALLFLLLTQVTRDTLRGVGRRARDLATAGRGRLLIALLVALAIALWAAVVYMLRQG